ncbi:MAG: hypothetical protein ACJ70P_00110 [Nitrososphaera sp.]
MTKTNTSMAIIATVAALAVLGIVVVMVAVTIPLQQVDAARPIGAGCPGTVPGANASKTRCFNG